MGDDKLTEGDVTRFEKNAIKLGYIKKPKKMTAFEVFALICIMSFLGSCLIIWSAWFLKCVQTGIFVFNWVSFAETTQQTAILFTQIVLGKILNALNQHFNPQKLLEELIDGHEATENLAQQITNNNNPFPQPAKPTPAPAIIPPTTPQK